jgi:hypothetical protein
MNDSWERYVRSERSEYHSPRDIDENTIHDDYDRNNGVSFVGKYVCLICEDAELWYQRLLYSLCAFSESIFKEFSKEHTCA